MVRPVILLGTVLLAPMSLVGTAVAASGCTSLELNTGGCSVGGSITGNGVDLTGESRTSGSGGSGGSGGGDWSPSGESGGAATAPTTYPEPRLRGYGPIAPIIIPRITRAPDAPVDAAAPIPVITLRDLASFNPAAPTASMEPNGWAVIGLDANFVAGATTQTIGGRLLGRPAEVLFTPVGFSWDYGDSARRTSPAGGATWAALHLPEFSPTPTSHVYRTKGNYSVVATAYYTAAYRFDGGAWQSVAGTLPLAAPRMSVVAVDGKTVLVARDCVQRAQGPGC